jgi:hypothetical protein
MKYDDASWHYGGDFPDGLPDEAGGTHIGMFVSWAILSGMAGSIHTTDFPEMLNKLTNREMNPGEWFISACDEKFTDEDLDDEGNRFSQHYYAHGEGEDYSTGHYLTDYCGVFAEFADSYSVPDTWESFERLKPVLDRRFAEWKSPKPTGWRRFFQ